MRVRDRVRIWATPVLLPIVICLAVALVAKDGYISRSGSLRIRICYRWEAIS